MVISSSLAPCACSHPSQQLHNNGMEAQLQQMMMMLMNMMQVMMTPGGQGASHVFPQPNWGGTPVSANPGLGGFLGSNSSSHPHSWSPASGNSAWSPQTNSSPISSDMRTNGSAVSTLMNSIQRTPVPPGCSGGGYCYRGVKYHLRKIGVNLTGRSAYMAADQLARSNRFREVRVSRSQLRQLPAGAIVVWNRGPGKPHGHISIANGRGQEASGRIRNQIVNYPSTHRVFLPR